MKMKKLPIGVSDFKNMVTGDYYYVDKTLFIKEIIDSGDTILLLPRPRRFGKTLNLSMLGYFYDCCPVAWAPDSDTQPPAPAKETRPPDTYKHLFDSLAISGAGREYLDKMGRYPVILIDEYDAPVHAGFNYGYYDEIINFMRNFLGGGLKDTDQYLEKGIVIGIMRIAKESIFSGFNNPGVYTLLSGDFSDYFGFTEEEVKTMLEDFQVPDMYDRVQLWYNGYRFGSRVIYNPWSILNFLRSKEKELIPYWLNTSDNQIVETLLTSSGKELKEELEQLIRGESIEKPIDENIILKNITHREDLLWSFLLMGGYLKQTAKRRHAASGKFFYMLSIPNEEVKTPYIAIIDNYFAAKINKKKLEIMLKALIDGDILLFEKMLKMIVLAVFSYHDFGDEPEKVYHALVAGLLVWISDTHEIKSNRDSGYGRYDIYPGGAWQNRVCERRREKGESDRDSENDVEQGNFY